ncbi:MAG: flavocytochrome c [Erysipelotrichaceae bacterium]|nr:flavocytochrome c [Erysipelotrichaceae bacterium]MDY5252155.1 flavocytochrome c [Erysipelotrichaceae bacterium]
MKKIFKMVLALTICISLGGCSNKTSTDETQSTAASSLKDGTYTGTGQGHNSKINVEVTVSNGTLDTVSVVGEEETNGIGDIAINMIVDKMNESKSTNIDTISSATISSLGIKNAVKNALEQAGADENYFASEPQISFEKANYEDKYEYDVVIVGAGGAGLSAAIEAANAGASVALLEKTFAVGGNTLVSGGGLNAPGTQHQIAKGIEDSVEKFAEDTYNSGDKEADLELVEVMAENALDATNWLIDEINVEFMPDRLQQFGGHSVPRALIPVGNHGDELVLKLEEAAKQAGVDIFRNVKAEEIIMEENRASGINADYEGQKITFQANKGVILATGGFASNVEMREQYNPDYGSQFKTTARAISTGDGIKMAEAVGAQLVDMEFIQVYPTCNPLTGIISYVANARMDGGILLNKEGTRFVDEMGRRDVISHAILDQTDGVGYLVWGQEIENIGHMTEVHAVEFQNWIDSDLLYVADTLEEAAEHFGLDVDKMQETINAYNESIKDGLDEDFNKKSSLVSIAEGPFYIQKVVPSSHHTMGGIKINTDAQVIGVDGKPIEGLFAAGEVVGDIHGTNRLGGNAITDCVVFGRIAGINASK